jgi:hypothetical protein
VQTFTVEHVRQLEVPQLSQIWVTVDANVYIGQDAATTQVEFDVTKKDS